MSLVAAASALAIVATPGPHSRQQSSSPRGDDRSVSVGSYGGAGGATTSYSAGANPYAKAGGRRPNTSGAPSRGRVRGGFSPIHNAGARKGVDASGLGEASMKATPLRMHVRAG